MSQFVAPTASNIAEWVRNTATTINSLLRSPFQTSASAPTNPIEGQSYYDSTLKKVRTWDGAAWQNHF